MQSVTLINRKSELVSVYLEARLEPNGDLILEGQDIGSFVEQTWGDSDYEYWLTVKAEQLPMVLSALHRDFPRLEALRPRNTEGPGPILAALKTLFEDGTFANDSRFRNWLNEKGIPSEFFSYA